MPINHIFVLMMENRSFDHMLGFSGIPGISSPSAQATVAKNTSGERIAITQDAIDQMDDLKHDYEDVRTQIRAPFQKGQTANDLSPITMDGFVIGNNPNAIRCFNQNAMEVRVLRQLAQEYCVFDNWFSSVPGPTWPNRFFVHAASSGGLDNSPCNLQSIGSVALESLAFQFENGTIFDWLDEAQLEWRIYHDDLLPQVLSIKGMPERFTNLTDPHFCWLHKLEDDLKSGYTPAYTFIEPAYDIINHFQHGNSQHATGTVTAGESLINWVYQTIRSSSIWPSSALFILYDEHGGFYDHVVPPTCPAPGDNPINHSKAEHPQNSLFNQLGVRVPAVLVSPFLNNTVVKATDKALFYDHSSVIKTLIGLFPTLKNALQKAGKTSLTHRDLNTASVDTLLSSTAQKPHNADQDIETFLKLQKHCPAHTSTSDTILDTTEDTLFATPLVSGFTTGFTHIAAAVELARQKHIMTPMLHTPLNTTELHTEKGALTFIRQLARHHPKLKKM